MSLPKPYYEADGITIYQRNHQDRDEGVDTQRVRQQLGRLRTSGFGYCSLWCENILNHKGEFRQQWSVWGVGMTEVTIGHDPESAVNAALARTQIGGS